MSIICKGLFGIKIPYNGRCIFLLQQIAGVTIDTCTQTWWIPVDKIYQVADVLRPFFPNIAERLLTSPRFQEVRDIIKQKQETIRKSSIIKADIEIPKPEGLDYKNYQYGGISFAYDLWKNKKHGVLIGDDMGCIAGDMEVTVRKGGATKRISLETFFKRYHKNPEGWYIRGLADGEFKQLPVKNVLDKGVKPVVQVTVDNGRVLVCTPDHELMTIDGRWVEAKDAMGERLAMNGIHKCPICEGTTNVITYPHSKYYGYCKSCMYKYLRKNGTHSEDVFAYRHRDGYYYLRGGDMHLHPRYSTSGLLEHIYVMEQWLNRPLEEGEEVHHINGDQTDNRPENLMITTRSEHHRMHHKTKNFGKSYTHHTGSKVIVVPEASKVVSVEPVGEAHVYDVMVDHPSHNFVANHFTVHNCGKTIQALGFLNKIRPDLGRTPKTLIICPASVKMNWYREAKKWIVPATSTIVIESGIPAQAIKHHNICIINYDILTKYEKAIIPIDWDVIVYDESHYMKNDKAKRSRAGNIFSKMSDFVMLLTGTPITNKPIDLWHQLNIIDWDMFKSRSTFVDRFCGGAQGIGATNLDELQELLRSTYMVRRMKDDVLTELPPKVRQIVEVSRRGFERVLEEESKYLSIVKKYETQMDELEATRRINNMTEEEFKKEAARLRSGKLGDMGEIARIRHQTALAKVPKVVDFVKDVLENRNKVIVFAHHRDVIEQIANEFKGESVVLYGGMSTGEKDASVQAFMKNPKIRVFVASIVAAGVGLTLTASDTVIFAEESWNPSDISQAEDRAHRIGQQNTVFVYHLVVEGSIDSYIMNKIISKQEVIDQSINTVIE